MEQRLAHIESQQAQILALLQGMTGKMDDHIDRVTTEKDRLDKLLFGNNGSPGLVVRLDRVEQAQERSRWLTRAIATAVVTLVVGALFALIRA